MIRLLLILVGIALLLYLIYGGFFYLNQRAILFPRHLIAVPSTTPVVPGMEQMWLETGAGRVEAWFLPAYPTATQANEAAPLVIIAHGNGDLIDHWPAPVEELRRQGFGVFLVEYPGYGRSQGTPTYQAIRETFLLAYDTIVRHPQTDARRIILLGHSVGGGAVTMLAEERPSAALILFSTFTSVADLAGERWLPAFAILDPFDNLAAVRRYPHPVLIIHGKHDRTIPYTHGATLHAAVQNGQLLALDCDHNGCVEEWDQFWLDLRPFFARAFEQVGGLP